MSTIRRAVTAFATASLLLAGSVAVAAPAQAAMPACNNHDWREGNTGVPGYVSGSTVERRCYLARGMNNNFAVELLQASMNYCYGEKLTVDGDFGALTQAALKRTQGKLGVSQDGSYGPVTRNAMQHRGISNGSGRDYCMRVFYRA